jgi:hypothetical protein
MNKLTLIIFSIFCLCSCSDKYVYNAEAIAKEYCSCMKENNAPSQYWYAKKVCDGRLTEENHFFRLMEVEIKVQEYGAIPNSLLDSVVLFQKNFDRYLKENCCKTVDNCEGGTDRPSDKRLGL